MYYNFVDLQDVNWDGFGFELKFWIVDLERL